MLTSENRMIGNALLLRHLHPGLKIAPIATHLRSLVIISVNSITLSEFWQSDRQLLRDWTCQRQSPSEGGFLKRGIS